MLDICDFLYVCIICNLARRSSSYNHIQYTYITIERAPDTYTLKYI